MAADGHRIDHVALENGKKVVGDAFVAAFRSYTPTLLKPLGVELPIYPVKGYSLTLNIVDPLASPLSTVMDETFKVAITRLADRIRVGATAELAGFSHRLREPRRVTLLRSLNDLFPNGGNTATAQFWTGLRPMSSDGTPVVGATRFSNLFVNARHGTLGWTMACSLARVVSDLVGGRRPKIAHGDLAFGRSG